MAQAALLPYMIDKLGAKESSTYGLLMSTFSALQLVGSLLSGVKSSSTLAEKNMQTHPTPACRRGLQHTDWQNHCLVWHRPALIGDTAAAENWMAMGACVAV
jgi:hypothetical protein